MFPRPTSRWLAKQRPEVAAPASFDVIDRIVLALIALTLLVWLCVGDTFIAPPVELVGGIAVAVRLARWRGEATSREPLLWILHLAYGWLALGFLLLAFSGFTPLLPATTALHALTVGAIGTMTLAVMTRASLGHTGRPLSAGPGTTAIYVLVTVAAVARLLAPLSGDRYVTVLAGSGIAWSGAFCLFIVLYAPVLMRPRETAWPI